MKFTLDNIDGQLVGIAELEGRLDARNSKPLQKTFLEWLEKTPLVVFDCSLLDFIDSSGLGAIVGCLRNALEKEGDLRLAGLNEKVGMVFELTQAKRLFSIFANRGEAASSFAAKPDSGTGR
ncbi:STAS domain-containing protein [Chlorobaculum thiosulfatiphilum]|jgi:anti-sigma B factor antagonist|uniref:Anti-sigma factor antagonist n=1 Tax=Chlorobaculum thiosulfatiphilum TaxID=115852 RepID=A0A5C4S819_CHLTI|nr:STAS domain-containing protein [Chlorobaculum thiosulfatiphilum]TNJ39297.1 STAS domain-containing protein [Chlorobaculum thiosulfatiphilum]